MSTKMRARLSRELPNKDFEEWFESVCNSYEMEVGNFGQLKVQGHANVHYTNFLVCLKCEIERLIELARPMLPRSFRSPSDKRVEGLLDAYLSTLPERQRKNIFNQLSYAGDSAAPEEFLSLLVDSPTDLDKAAFRYWLWQVKRKASGLEVGAPIWLNLFGKQGSGKTLSLSRLLAPLEMFVWHTSVVEACDPRTYFAYENSSVIFCDELAGSARSEIETIKQNVTAKVLSSRILGTHRIQAIPNNASFLSASNVPLATLIKDTTGARRFYELTSRNEMNFAAVKEFDTRLIWKAIDESQASPLADFREELSVAQEAHRTIAPLEEWWLSVDKECATELVPVSSIIVAANNFMEHHGFRQENSSALGRFLVSINVPKARKSDGVYYEVPSSLKGFRRAF